MCHDEVLIDEELRAALDEYLLKIEGVTSGEKFGGISYNLNNQPFAILMEGVIALRLSAEYMRQALTLAGVSPFRPPALDEPVEGWLQFVLLLPEDVPELEAWYRLALGHAA